MWDIKKGLKLKKLYVNNYKVLKNFEIDFCDEFANPLPIVVLAGVNGSGKTAILEIISQTDGKNAKLTSIYNGIEKNITTLISQYRKEIFYCGINDSSFLKKKKEEFEIIYIPYVLNNFSFVENAIVEFVDKLIYEKDIKASVAYSKCAEFIKNTLDDIELNIDFSRFDRNKRVYFRKNSDEFLLNSLSSGEKSLFARILYFYFMEIKDKVILIDEPELSLHPTWQAKVLKLYENYAIKNNCQIIIATHSPLIIGSSKNEYLRVLDFENDKVVVRKYKSYGLEFDRILLEIMGVKNLRVEEVESDFNKLREYIQKKEWRNFSSLFKKMKKELGEDLDLKLLLMQAKLKGFDDKDL